MVDRPQPDTEIMLLIKLGFHGFVEHEKVADSLGAAVRAIANGRLWISDDLMHQYMNVAAESEGLAPDKPLLPTLREREVLELVRQRLSNREIASLLSVSEHTVKYHLANIRAKYGVSSRRELETTARGGAARIWQQISKPPAH
jgi:DNA-binding NarL/FixJ family response regulator